ncbi:MAG: transposase [Peptococcaceae bacterium]|nr:transposase [Peptococcaceae bacterium]
MYNYHPGEVNNPGFELMLHLVRVLILVALIIVTGGVGVAAGLPAFVSGTLAGVVVLLVFLYRPFFEVINYSCPHCGNTKRVIKSFGSYHCSNCGGDSKIQ